MSATARRAALEQGPVLRRATRAGGNCPIGLPRPPSARCICNRVAAWPRRRPATGSSASFRYDPAEPTPTIGGRLLSPDGGYRDDSALAVRRDVLSFTSDVLTEDLCVFGNPIAELAHSSDNPYVDVFVRISEVDAKGRSRNVSDAYRRLDGSARDGALTLELDAIAHRFRAGTRIRVLIAGGSHPRFARNLGTGEAIATGDELHACPSMT